MRLLGVVGARGRHAEEMRAYIAGREVASEPAGADAYRCTVGRNDLARAVLYNGGGRVASGAPPDLREAEQKARARRRGLWAR